MAHDGDPSLLFYPPPDLAQHTLTLTPQLLPVVLENISEPNPPIFHSLHHITHSCFGTAWQFSTHIHTALCSLEELFPVCHPEVPYFPPLQLTLSTLPCLLLCKENRHQIGNLSDSHHSLSFSFLLTTQGEFLTRLPGLHNSSWLGNPFPVLLLSVASQHLNMFKPVCHFEKRPVGVICLLFLP